MLGDMWKDKVDGVDFNSADDINQVAHAVIELEDKGVEITVDNELSETSERPVQNKIITSNINTLYGESAQHQGNIDEIIRQIGDIDSALEELHNYAEAIIGGAE